MKPDARRCSGKLGWTGRLGGRSKCLFAAILAGGGPDLTKETYFVEVDPGPWPSVTVDGVGFSSATPSRDGSEWMGHGEH